MWGDSSCSWWCCFDNPKQKQPPHQQQHNPLLLQEHEIHEEDDDDDDDDHPSTAPLPIYSLSMILSSWLNRRRRRYIFLALCSPVLLPLLCATFPILCAVEICFRLCRRGRRRRRRIDADGGGDGLRRCEEGGAGNGGLLHRYLEDQLGLILGSSMYDCGDEDGDGRDCFRTGADLGYFDTPSPLLQ